MAKRKGKKKSQTVSVNFEGVESSGRIASGSQVGEVLECELKDGPTAQYLNFKIQGKGGVLYHTCSLAPQSLWNLRTMMEAMGLEVEESVMDIDPSDFVGLTFGMEVDHETYNGKKKGVIVDLFPEDDVEESDDEEEEEDPEGEEEEDEEEDEPPKKKSKGKIKKGSKVTFEEDDEEVEGKVIEIDEDEGYAVVKVGKEEWEIELEELELA